MNGREKIDCNLIHHKPYLYGPGLNHVSFILKFIYTCVKTNVQPVGNIWIKAIACNSLLGLASWYCNHQRNGSKFLKELNTNILLKSVCSSVLKAYSVSKSQTLQLFPCFETKNLGCKTSYSSRSFAVSSTKICNHPSKSLKSPGYL